MLHRTFKEKQHLFNSLKELQKYCNICHNTLCFLSIVFLPLKSMPAYILYIEKIYGHKQIKYQMWDDHQ